MSEPAANVVTTPTASTATLAADNNAPFIYFDAAVSYGVLNGAIQIELMANVLIPTPDGGVRADGTFTAHLRCSPVAAASLRNAIDKAILIAVPSQGSTN